MLPILLVLLLTQGRTFRNTLLKGFALVALALAGLSAAMCGWSVFTAYPEFLIHLQAQPFAGIIPQAMANFRGLIYLFFPRDQSPWTIAAVLILSAVALTKTVSAWKHARLASSLSIADNESFDLAFASTVLFALLVSYHLNPHDLSLALLPIPLVIRHALARATRYRSQWILLLLFAIFFLPPLHLWTLKTGIYSLLCLPLFLLFLIAGTPRQHSTASGA